jgi:aryl sulfotransferase
MNDQNIEVTQPSRPTSLEEMSKRQALQFNPEDLKKAAEFKLRPTDIVVTPYGKSGTTWIQQIVHTLRTRGDMDFDDISRVVPWIEVSAGLGIDLDAPQRAEPRAFKSHMDYDQIQKGAKYIISVRNPADALVSAYHFMEGWYFEPGSISIEEFALQRYVSSGGYWRHLKSWWPHRNDQNVLFLAYEHMNKNPVQTIERVAEFCNIPLDEELKAITIEHSSLEFMKKHKNRFDDFIMRERSERLCNLPPGSDSSKVRDGKVDSHKGNLNNKIMTALDEVWDKEIKQNLGFSSYADLLLELT